MAKKKKMIKRADGRVTQKGLFDNIRERQKRGISRDKGDESAPTKSAMDYAAKTSKKAQRKKKKA